MTARPMPEEERQYALQAAAAVVDDADNGRTVWTSTAKTEALARALLSTSAAVRGMREALEMAERSLRESVDYVDDAIKHWPAGSPEYECAIAVFGRCEGTLGLLAALSGIEPGEDEQARGQGRSAPISTDTKGTSNGIAAVKAETGGTR